LAFPAGHAHRWQETKYTIMAKNKKAAFVKWIGPLLDALRDLGDSGNSRSVWSFLQ